MLRLAFVLVALAAGCSPKPEKPKIATPVHRPVATPAPSSEPAPKGLVREASLARVRWAGEGAGALLDVVAIGPGEALAVGEPGAVRITEGGERVDVAPFPDGIATSVWADGASFAVVVGYAGMSYVREGAGAWVAAPTGTDANLSAVWGRSKNGVREVYAGGARGLLLRWNGSAWEKLPAPETAQVSRIAGNASWIWALGESGGGGSPGEGVLLRSAGGEFTDACPDLACGGALYDGWSPVQGELWTVGIRGEVVRYTGARLAQAEWIATGTREDLTGVWGTGVSDLFVIGDAGTCLRWDGAVWKPLDAGDRDLRGIDGLPSGEAWIVGADGSIHRVAPPPAPSSTPG